MRKFFCGIGVFFFLCVITFGYYHTYQAGEMYCMRNISKEKQGKNSSFFPDEEKEKLLSVLSQDAPGYGNYYLKDQNGYVVIYEKDKKTMFEPTSIKTESLPDRWKSKVKKGFLIKNLRDVYSFLENYSS